MNIRRQSGTFQFEEDPFSKDARGISKIYHEVFLLLKFSQKKPNVKGMNFDYQSLYYTFFKNRNDKEIVGNEFENSETDYNNFKDFITPNHYIGRKNKDVMLK